MVGTRLENPRLEECARPPSLRGEALGRLIWIYFRDVARQEADGSLEDRFRDFARAYFLLAQGHEDLFRVRRAEVLGTPAEMLAEVLSAAAASDELAPLPVPAHRAATWIGINLVTLQQQVGAGREDGTLTPDEAAALLTTVLCEGLQA